MHGERSSTGLCNCVLINFVKSEVYDFQDSKSWKYCVQGYVLKLAIKIAIQAALKEEAKDKGEESGVEDGSV